MTETALGVIIGGLIALWINLATGRLSEFNQIKAHLGHEVFNLRSRFQRVRIDPFTPNIVWLTTEALVQTVFQPAYFRLEMENQRNAKAKVGALMNELIKEIYGDYEKVEKPRRNADPHAADALVGWILARLELNKDRYTNSVMAIKPSLGIIFFPGITKIIRSTTNRFTQLRYALRASLRE